VLFVVCSRYGGEGVLPTLVEGTRHIEAGFPPVRLEDPEQLT